jgi:photosystem II stability/assembly factor-like uncharacterized protein
LFIRFDVPRILANSATTTLSRAACVVVALAALFVPQGAADAAGARLRDNLYGVHAMDAANTWIVGAFGTIFHSADGGVTWQAQSSGTTENLFGVDFADTGNGWVVGRSGVILRTKDSGGTWTRQRPEEKNHLFSVDAVSADHAVAIGDWGTVLVTTDGGATWQKRSLDRDIILNAQHWIDGSRGWIVGEAGLIVATADGGATWTEQNSGVMKTLFGVAFADAQRGWAVGLDGLILYTDNGGLEWRVQHGNAELAGFDQVTSEEVAENPTLFDVSVSGATGYVVGDGGSVFASTDGGLQWKRAVVPAAVRLRWIRSASLAGNGTGLLAGANGLTLRVAGSELVAGGAD